ncbi:sphingomyelin phosphodiesterase-like [Lycorma delicatula]|uniref:sphingomyelin phosphodiesterase-like n=1 Tax=Lycorma delicatula TaxID=130591 RepID=UPI003F515243
MEILAVLHRRCCLQILAAYRMTSREAAEVLAHVMPIDLLIDHRRKCRELRMLPSSEKKRLIVANIQQLMNTWQKRWDVGEKDYFSSFYDEMSSYVSSGIISETLQNFIDSFALPESVQEGDLSGLSDFSKNSLCMICDLGISNVLTAYYYGLPGSFVEKIAISICQLFRLQSPDVCEGLIHLNLDVILHIADVMENMTSLQFCGTVLETLQCYGPQPVVEWEVDISTINKIKSTEEEGSHVNIVQITDLHYDEEYMIGGKTDCGQPLCCRHGQGQADKPDEAAGFWGDYRFCDIPWYVVEDALSNIASNHKEAEFIYMTGDIIAHNVWSTTKEGNKRGIEYSGKKFYELLEAKVYPILGNHEPHPANVFAPPYIKGDKSTLWLYETFFDAWGYVLTKEARETFLTGGYYTVTPKPGFRIIALNNMFAYTYNWWMIMDPVDPAGELQWLAETLYESEKSMEKVHILAHIPPGTPDTLRVWSREYARIIFRFEDIIMAQFNGHTHKEQFNVYIHENQARSIAFNAGSVTPYAKSNPNYRVYTVDSTTWEIKDYETYVYNLTEANQNGENSPKWYKLYSFKEAYGVESLHPESVKLLAYNMAKNKTLLEAYNRYFIKAGDAGLMKECNSHCQEVRLCEIVTTVSGDKKHCNELVDIFKKS